MTATARREEMITILRYSIPEEQWPKLVKRKGNVPQRDLYRRADGLWFFTYGLSLGPYEPFNDKFVCQMLSEGVLTKKHDDIFSLAEAYK